MTERATIPGAMRRLVIGRAADRCEYCRIPDVGGYYSFEVDHVVPLKHGGKTDPDNLAWACYFCNRHKGTDVGSFDPETGDLARFFHPRHDAWTDHFALEGAQIIPLTPEGRVTARILRFNSADRVAERHLLVTAGLYP